MKTCGTESPSDFECKRGLSSPDELDLFLAGRSLDWELGEERDNPQFRTGTGFRPALIQKVFFIFLKSFNLQRNEDVATPRVSEL